MAVPFSVRSLILTCKNAYRFMFFVAHAAISHYLINVVLFCEFVQCCEHGVDKVNNFHGVDL